MTDPVPVVLMDLPTSIRGFVTTGSDNNPCIVINSRMPVELQKKTYDHEMEHISSGQFDDENYDDFTEYGNAV